MTLNLVAVQVLCFVCDIAPRTMFSLRFGFENRAVGLYGVGFGNVSCYASFS